MKVFNFKEIAKSERIDRLKEDLFANKPEIESTRAILLTESYKKTFCGIQAHFGKSAYYNKIQRACSWQCDN